MAIRWLSICVGNDCYLIVLVVETSLKTMSVQVISCKTLKLGYSVYDWFQEGRGGSVTSAPVDNGTQKQEPCKAEELEEVGSRIQSYS